MRDFQNKSGKNNTNADPSTHFEITIVEEITEQYLGNDFRNHKYGEDNRAKVFDCVSDNYLTFGGFFESNFHVKNS